MSTNTPIGIFQIGQIAITVQDLDRAVAFYRDTLGLTFLFQAPPGLAFSMRTGAFITESPRGCREQPICFCSLLQGDPHPASLCYATAAPGNFYR